MEPSAQPPFSSRPTQFKHDDRIVAHIQGLVAGYENPDFEKYFVEAVRHYNFTEYSRNLIFKENNIYNIKSWDNFIELLNVACQKMKDNLWNKNNEFDRTTAHFLIMCQYVIKNHSPNGYYAKELLNSFMSNATIDLDSPYSTSNIEGLRLYNVDVPLGIVPDVRKSAYDLERLINDEGSLMGIFETESIRIRVVQALAKSPMMFFVLQRERDLNNLEQNRLTVIDSARSVSHATRTYLWWLTRVKPDSVDDLFKEMKTVADKILNEIPESGRMSLKAFISSIGETEKTLAILNEKMKSMCSTGYFLNEFNADELMKLLDVELIAGGILEMRKEPKNKNNQTVFRNNDIVFDAQMEFLFVRKYLKLEVVRRIMQNDVLFVNWRRRQFRKNAKKLIRQSASIDKPVDKLPTLTVKNIADFLKVEEYEVIRYVLKPIVSVPSKSSIESANENPNSYAASTSNMVVESIKESPTETRIDADKAAEMLLNNKIKYKKFLDDILKESSSYLTSIRKNVSDTSSKFANFITNSMNQSSTYLSDAYNGVVHVTQKFFKPGEPRPNKTMEWVPGFRPKVDLNPNNSNSGNESMGNTFDSRMNVEESRTIAPFVDQPPSAGEGTPAPNPAFRRGNPVSTKETKLSVKTGGGSNISNSVPTSSFVTPAPVYPTSQNVFNRVYGGINVPISRVTSNVPANIYRPVGGGSMASNPNVFDQPGSWHRASNPNVFGQPVGGGSRASNSNNPNNVMGGTPSSNANTAFNRYGTVPPSELQSLASSTVTTPANSRAPSRAPSVNSIQSEKRDNRGGKPRHSMSKNKKTLRRNPRKLISRQQKYSRRK